MHETMRSTWKRCIFCRCALAGYYQTGREGGREGGPGGRGGPIDKNCWIIFRGNDDARGSDGKPCGGRTLWLRTSAHSAHILQHETTGTGSVFHPKELKRRPRLRFKEKPKSCQESFHTCRAL